MERSLFLCLKRLIFRSCQERVDRVLGRGGGLIKRIDEHRELVEFLLKECPDVFERYEWTGDWAVRQDVFLCGLLELADRYRGGPYSHVRAFPVERVYEGKPGLIKTSLKGNPEWMCEGFVVPSSFSSRRESFSEAIRCQRQKKSVREMKGLFFRLSQLIRRSCRRKVAEVLGREGGLAKRIDEHRRLAGLLAEEYFEVLERHRWVKDWLIRQDIFLCGLLEIVEGEGWSSSVFVTRDFPIEKLHANEPREIKVVMNSNPRWRCGAILTKRLESSMGEDEVPWSYP